MKSNELQFRPEHKLLQAKQFGAVFDQPSFKIHSDAFTALVRFSNHNLSESSPLVVTVCIETARLGLVVAKKKIKRAHERNRVKRIIRDSFRLHRKNLPFVDVVFIVKAQAQHLSNEDLHAQMQTAWLQLIRKAVKLQSV